MASRRDVEQFATGLRGVRALALRELRGFWATLDLRDAVRAREALQEFLPLLVANYGETAVSVAADFFEDMRDAAGAPGSFGAVLADQVEPVAVRHNVAWAVGPLFGEDGDALARLAHITDRMTLQPGRDTIARSVANDPSRPRWARVPTGPETCAFCRMTASRGASYTSPEAAGRGRAYHADCDCTPTPVWDGQPYPDGYDPDALLEQYLEAREDAGTGHTKAILSELREQQGTN